MRPSIPSDGLTFSDDHYMEIGEEAAKESRCTKKQLGCALVLRKELNRVIKGTNGPPKELGSCEPCPRKDSQSGTGLHLCRAVHAERATLLDCARLGLKTEGAILFNPMGVPCRDCLVELIYAGVAKIVVREITYYDSESEGILKKWVSEGGVFRTEQGWG